MAHSPNPAATSRTGVPAAHAQLESLVGIAIKHANEHMMEMVNRMVARLLDVSEPGVDARAVYQRVKSGNLLKNNGYAYFHLASTALEAALRKEVALLLPAPQSGRAPTEALALVPMEEMDRSVAFGAIGRPFEILHSEPLATLNVRLGFLLGRELLRTGQNPFRPEVFLIALNEAWCEFEPDAGGHALLPGLLRPAILFDFAPMLEALNTVLMRKGALPGSSDSLRIRKSDNAAKAKAERVGSKAALAEQLRKFFSSGDAASAGFDDAIPLIPDLPAMPKGSGGWRPSGADGFHTAPTSHASPTTPAAGFAPAAPGHAGAGFGGPSASALAQGQANAQLIDFLGKLQRSLPAQAGWAAPAGEGPNVHPNQVFYLPRLKESMPKGSLTHGDESTIDLLSRVFETVFIDDNIPQETRELIQALQIPVLKAALLDKNFFFQEAHPARRMIDLMSRVGWEQRNGADDPLFQAMQRGVDRVGRDAGAEMEAFAGAVAELEATIAAEESHATAAISEPIARALKQEKMTAATRSAENAVALRVGNGEVVAVVESFLANKWTSVLTLAYSVEDDKPGAVGNATKTMDALIWSVKPKITQEQRKSLIAKLPGLLATLNKWLDIIQWQDAERLQFFAELAECHASIVRAPIELSPERQLEIALEAAQQDAIRRIEKENAVAAREEAAVDEAVIAVDGLERGMWLEFDQPDASVRTVKLAWISPLRTLYIFSTGARQEAFSMSAEKLAAAWREQQVRLIRQDGVVARALSEAMQQAAVNDPAIAARHGAAA